MTNQKLNNELDRMFKEYGIEYDDFGFTDDMNNEQIAAIIESRELEILECLVMDEESSAGINSVDKIQKVLRIFPASKRFVNTYLLGDTRKTYRDLMDSMPKDHTVKTWLALHIRWADTLGAI